MDIDQLKQGIQKYFLTPLTNLPIAQIKLLDTNHDQSVQDFENAVAPLFAPNGSQFEGQGANAVADCFQSYLTAEGALSNYESYGLTDRITTLLRKCAMALTDEEAAMKALPNNTPLEAGAAAAASTAVKGEEIGAPEEGADPPSIPIVQVIIGIVALGVGVWAYQDQQNKVNALSDIMTTWVNDMKNLALQPDPKGSQLPGPPAQQIDPGASYDAGQLVANALGTSLSPEQEQLAEQLANEYGIPIEDVVDIMVKNPNLTPEQLRALLAEYTNVINANPGLVKKYGALAVFEEFIALAAYDPAAGGDYTKRKPISVKKDIQDGISEAMIEMGAMEQNKLPWPLKPSSSPGYDAEGPDGLKVDTKELHSVSLSGQPYNAADFVQRLQQKDFSKGEKVLLDDRDVTQQEIDDTYDELKKIHKENNVFWWPNDPSQLKSSPP